MRLLPIAIGMILLSLSQPGPAAGASPGLAVSSPAERDVIQGTAVTVRYEATGIAIVPSSVPVVELGKRPDANRPDQGHLHLMLDLFPLVIWERTEPYTFVNVPPGEHELHAELVNNDHSSLSPPVVQRIRLRTVADPAASVPGAPVSVLPPSGEPDHAMVLFALIAAGATGLSLRRLGQRIR